MQRFGDKEWLAVLDFFTLNTAMQVTDDHVSQIAAVLNGLTLNEQLSCLMTVMYIHIIAACQYAGRIDEADLVVDNLIAAMPRQWQITKAMALYGGLPN